MRGDLIWVSYSLEVDDELIWGMAFLHELPPPTFCKQTRIEGEQEDKTHNNTK